MKRIILKILILGLAVQLYSQPYFIKIVDYDSLPQASQQIVKVKDNYYILGYWQTCNDLQSQCGGILKMDDYGKIQQKVLLEKFSNNPNSILIDSNKILLTGEEYYTDDEKGNKFQVYEINPSNLEVTKNYFVKDDNNPFINMFQLCNTIWNNKTVVAGSGNKVNGGSRGLIYIYNKENILDTLIKIDYLIGNIIPWECYVDKDNNLTIHLQVEDWITRHKYESFIKYDTNYKKMKEWRSNAMHFNNTVPWGFEDKAGNIIISTVNKQAQYINDLSSIRVDSTLNWRMDWYKPSIVDQYNQVRYIERLRPARNGDIIGVGRYGDQTGPPYLKNLPFIFRVNTEGKLLWHKVYYKNKTRPTDLPNNAFYLQGDFSDVVEADNGDLIAVGRIENNIPYDPRVGGPRVDGDILIARLRSDGCLEPGCGELNIIDPLTTAITDVALPDFKINIYPNPLAGDEVTIAIQSDHDLDHLEITIHDLTGKQIARDKAINGDNKINISQAGYYLITVTSDGKVLYNNKLIKI
jgi:hypothetical protein